MNKKVNTHGGPGRNQGRKSREELGLEPVRNTTVQVEPSVIKVCREKHCSLGNALRFAAKHIVDKINKVEKSHEI